MSYKEYTVKVYDNGSKEWFLDGKFHREDGPAVEWTNDYKQWYLNGKYHREDGPAIEFFDGTKYWYLNGKHHREDGPAVEYANGSKYWFLNGNLFSSEEEWKKEVVKLHKKQFSYKSKIIKTKKKARR